MIYLKIVIKTSKVINHQSDIMQDGRISRLIYEL